MKPADLVLIQWDDAHGNHTWREAAEVWAGHKAEACKSVGWVLRKDKAGVTIFGSWGDTGDGDEDFEISDTLFIPRGMIKKVTVLKKGKKPARRKQ